LNDIPQLDRPEAMWDLHMKVLEVTSIAIWYRKGSSELYNAKQIVS